MKKMTVKAGKITEVQGAAPPRLAYTTEEASAMLGVHPVTLQRLVRRGLLHPARATRNFLFPSGELDRFLRDNSVTQEVR